MIPLRPATLAICFALLATGCNQSVDARFESTLERAIDKARTPEDAAQLQNSPRGAETPDARRKAGMD
jgi:hypothetical protein